MNAITYHSTREIVLYQSENEPENHAKWTHQKSVFPVTTVVDDRKINWFKSGRTKQSNTTIFALCQL